MLLAAGTERRYPVLNGFDGSKTGSSGPEGVTWGVLPLSKAPGELQQMVGVVHSGAALPLWCWCSGVLCCGPALLFSEPAATFALLIALDAVGTGHFEVVLIRGMRIHQRLWWSRKVSFSRATLDTDGGSSFFRNP